MRLNAQNPGLAVVIGARGGIGSALLKCLQEHGDWPEVIGLGRDTDPALDLEDEATIAHAAQHIALRELPLRLVINATGALSRYGCSAEKSWKQIDPRAMQRSFVLNSIGPALLMKHFLPQLAREGRSVFATLSARVGSIGDNRLGGWYSYRAAKAALNQLVHTAAIELRRSRPEALCVALHPGTVATPLTADYAKAGLEVQDPETAAQRILAVIAGLDASQSGGFFDHKGVPVPW